MLERGGRPSGGFVAIFTNIICLKMRRRLAGRIGAVMTRRAIGGYSGMVKGRTAPSLR